MSLCSTTASSSAVCLATLLCACGAPGPLAASSSRSGLAMDRRGEAIGSAPSDGHGTVADPFPAAANTEEATAVVSLHGLDLRSERDRLAARRLIRTAARRVCGDVDGRVLMEVQRAEDCRLAAAANANRELDRRVLALGPPPGTEVATAATVSGR